MEKIYRAKTYSEGEGSMAFSELLFTSEDFLVVGNIHDNEFLTSNIVKE